jgi:hypothetical protein
MFLQERYYRLQNTKPTSADERLEKNIAIDYTILLQLMSFCVLLLYEFLLIE